MSFGPLIDIHSLAALLEHPGLVLFDCRHQLTDVNAGRRAYADGHLPKARFLHLDDDLSALPGAGLCGGRHPLPSPAEFASRMANHGVTDQSLVVAYDDSGGMVASRIWWMLRWIGHPFVAVLDGGIQAWDRAGMPQTLQGEPATVKGSIKDGRSAAAWVPVEKVLAELEAGECIVVDARSPDRFQGQNETIDPVAGHIPGAVNRFFRENLDTNGCFKSPQQLCREWEAVLAGREPGRVIHQCGSGVSACHNLLAMELSGLSGSRLYAGSWSEWCSGAARPVAVGA